MGKLAISLVLLAALRFRRVRCGVDVDRVRWYWPLRTIGPYREVPGGRSRDTTAASALESAAAGPSAALAGRTGGALNSPYRSVTVSISTQGYLRYETAVRQAEHSHARQLERVLDLLEFLAERGEARAGEIAEALAAPRASVHRLLAVLQERGYIERVARTHTYRLGPALRRLASRSTS